MQINQTHVATVIIGIIVGGFAIGLVDANRPKPLFSSADSNTSNSIPDECVPYAEAVQAFVNEKNAITRPVEDYVFQGWEQYIEELTGFVTGCAHAICDPLYDNWAQADDIWSNYFDTVAEPSAQRLAQAEQILQEYYDVSYSPAWESANEAYGRYEAAYNEAQAAWQVYSDYYDSLPDEWSEEQLAEERRLYAIFLRLDGIADDLAEVYERLNEALIPIETEYDRLTGLRDEAETDDAPIAAEEQRLNEVASNLRQIYVSRNCVGSNTWEPPALNPNTAPPSYRDFGGIGVSPSDTNPKPPTKDSRAKVY